MDIVMDLSLGDTVMGLLSVGAFVIFWERKGFVAALPLLLFAFAWLSFAVWDYYCEKQGYNIRIDLLILIPIFSIVTIIEVIYVVALLRKRNPTD